MKTGIKIIKLPSGWYADLTNEIKISYGYLKQTQCKIPNYMKRQHVINYINAFELILINENDFDFGKELWYHHNSAWVNPKLSNQQIKNLKKRYEKDNVVNAAP